MATGAEHRRTRQCFAGVENCRDHNARLALRTAMRARQCLGDAENYCTWQCYSVVENYSAQSPLRIAMHDEPSNQLAPPRRHYVIAPARAKLFQSRTIRRGLPNCDKNLKCALYLPDADGNAGKAIPYVFDATAVGHPRIVDRKARYGDHAKVGTNGLLNIIEQYRRCSHNNNPTESWDSSNNETQNNYLEFLRLKTRIDFLQRSQRNLLGEDLQSLNIKELDQLENQIEVSLSHIRSTKSQVITNEISDLKCKENKLQEFNTTLRKKLQEIVADDFLHSSMQEGDNSNIKSGRSEFHPLECDPSVQIGSNPSVDLLSGEMAFMAEDVDEFVRQWM
ncbi:hypothetical protein ZIOFF_002951 [Zingiber officinale]|uniref:K-box domain-containing protein n=1 Tax=Zingiber officinale TaxID=94328 RepID=A0A8J5IRY4_ZINOF|nr:hypothetical protein ZIOFF_002951 [Zingiber officinale]